MSSVEELFDSIDIDLIPSFSEASFAPDDINSLPFGSGEPSHSAYLMDQLKEHFQGSRPAGSDVVYLMTATPITGGTAGFTDCIGGIRYPGRAFSVGEAAVDDTDEWGWFQENATAKIAGHEIAHLLGAHHHYANCAEGNKAALVPEMAPCTLMFNDIGLVSLGFSNLEAGVVRAHVEKFAASP